MTPTWGYHDSGEWCQWGREKGCPFVFFIGVMGTERADLLVLRVNFRSLNLQVFGCLG